jgi:hypothetical protein
MDIVVVGIDLGKNVCSVVGLGAAGQVLVRRRDSGHVWTPPSVQEESFGLLGA